MNKFEVLEVIGEGTYGIVVKALQKDTNEIVAIKKFKDNAKNFIRRELKMLNSLKSCEYIINLKEAYKRKEKVYFIFEYVERSLLNLLQEYPQGVSQNICKSLLFQLCKAIEKCHSLEIIHRDIKPENLLIDRNYRLKLCDFGFARQTDQEDNKPLTEYVATRWYRAPELLLFCPYSKPVDIWAIGCIACEMSNGRPIFAGTSDLDQIHKILSVIGPLPENMEELKRNGKYINFKLTKYDKTFDKKFADIMSENMLDFTKKCLILNPKSRIVISECLMHPALELQLKSFVSKKIGKNISTISAMRLRDKQKIDGRESRNKKAISVNDYPLLLPISRQSENINDSIENLNSNEETTYLAEKIVSTNHLNYLKPKIIDNRIKTTQYYQSDDELNEKRMNDETTNNLMANKVCMNIALSNNLNRKQSLLTRNEMNNLYESVNLDTERARLNNSTLSTYGNSKTVSQEQIIKNEMANNYIKLLRNRNNDSKLSVKRSKSTLENKNEMNNRRTPDYELALKFPAKYNNQYLLQVQHLNKLEISNLSVNEIYAPRNTTNELFKSPRISNIKKANSQISHNNNRENFLF